MTTDILTAEDVAKRWQCSTTAVYDMVSRGDLKGFRVGRLLRFTAEEIHQYEHGEEVR